MQIIIINGAIRTHKEEFDDDEFQEQEKASAPRNVVCQNFGRRILVLFGASSTAARRKAYTYLHVESNDFECDNDGLHNIAETRGKSGGEENEMESLTDHDHDVESFGVRANSSFDVMCLDTHQNGELPVSPPNNSSATSRRRKRSGFGDEDENDYSANTIQLKILIPDGLSNKSKSSDAANRIEDDIDEDDDDENMLGNGLPKSDSHDVSLGKARNDGSSPRTRVPWDPKPPDTCEVNVHGPVISLRVSIAWLLIMTLCISAMSDILVDTIDGFAGAMHLSEVFTSMVIIPFFSNVAEQVSAFLFAYRNEMDLCVGVTVGSAIQIATFVLPGSVVVGMLLDRNMTLYFHSFETVCLFFGVVVVAAILQNGTTNWLVGAMLVGIYIMFAAGIWFHEKEVLNVDADTSP
jgi:Ca2+/H+ antiporter